MNSVRYTVMGDIVNLAARLMSRAAVDTILTDQITFFRAKASNWSTRSSDILAEVIQSPGVSSEVVDAVIRWQRPPHVQARLVLMIYDL